jgi:hypothetical protein
MKYAYVVCFWFFSAAAPWPLPFKAALALAQGAAEKIKRENDVQLGQLAKKSTHVPPFFFFKVRFWAFLGKGVRKYEKPF